MKLRLSFLLATFLLRIPSALAADVPGGLLRDSEGLQTKTYEMVLGPSYLLGTGGAYLSSEVRYQLTDDMGVGFGFGAGEVGFNFGGNATWYVVPDLAGQPAVSVLGGLYFNRLAPDNFLVFKVAPMLSKGYKLDWGKITPYAGLEFLPSLRLGAGSNEFSMKTSMGLEFALQAVKGLRFRTEVGIAVLATYNELDFGISYPFSAL